jgi:hypothetical protein
MDELPRVTLSIGCGLCPFTASVTDVGFEEGISEMIEHLDTEHGIRVRVKSAPL